MLYDVPSGKRDTNPATKAINEYCVKLKVFNFLQSHLRPH